ncbi:MAG: hypothetical protein RL026_895 [Pseudomonadota bacterium]
MLLGRQANRLAGEMKHTIALLLIAPSLAGAADLCASLALFTPTQVAEGKVYFESSCGLCHQFTLQGRTPGNLANEVPNSFDGFSDFYVRFVDNAGGSVPPLVGPKFMGKFKSFPEFMLYAPSASSTPQFYPPAAPKTDFWPDTNVRLAAYILAKNCEKPAAAG